MPIASTNVPSTPWVIKPLVPDKVYTDPTEFLEYFYEAALKAATRRAIKWILYLSALEEERKISLERIQHELKIRESKDVSLDTIRNVLIRLSRGDLLEYRELGGWFQKVDVPILVEFFKVCGRVDVEGQNQNLVRSELDDRYRKLERRVHEYKGYLAEVFMAQVLLSNQNRRKQPLPGHFFNSIVLKILSFLHCCTI